MVELVVGQVSNVGQPELQGESCLPPEHSVTVVLDKDNQVPEFDPNGVRISIVEQGGWSIDQKLTLRSVADIWTSDALEVAPGRYSMAVYLDENGDEKFTSCEQGGADRYVGQIEMEVGTSNPAPQLDVSLTHLCDQR